MGIGKSFALSLAKPRGPDKSKTSFPLGVFVLFWRKVGEPVRLAIIAIAISLAAIGPALAVDTPTPVGIPHKCNNYPPAALDVDASGEATLAFDISPDGSVANVRIDKSSGNADLDSASIQCASQWRYKPSDALLSWRATVEWRINSVMPRAPAGALHNCSFEPAADERNRITDRAAAQFLVLRDGSTSEIMIARSSGDPLLDHAFLTCVAGWKYIPALLNETPFDVAWGAQMEWTERKGVRIGENGAKPHSCSIYPPVEFSEHVEGTAILFFTINQEGRVEEPSIARSSGNDELDKAALTCAQRWKYKAATQDGNPIAVQWAAQVTWRNGHTFVLELEPSRMQEH